MSKSKDELDALKEEVEAVNEKLQELTPEEIAQVNGGLGQFGFAIRLGPDGEMEQEKIGPGLTKIEYEFND